MDAAIFSDSVEVPCPTDESMFFDHRHHLGHRAGE
jgi:hypothetical protein